MSWPGQRDSDPMADAKVGGNGEKRDPGKFDGMAWRPYKRDKGDVRSTCRTDKSRGQVEGGQAQMDAACGLRDIDCKDDEIGSG